MEVLIPGLKRDWQQQVISAAGTAVEGFLYCTEMSTDALWYNTNILNRIRG